MSDFYNIICIVIIYNRLLSIYNERNLYAILISVYKSSCKKSKESNNK